MIKEELKYKWHRSISSDHDSIPWELIYDDEKDLRVLDLNWSFHQKVWVRLSTNRELDKIKWFSSAWRIIYLYWCQIYWYTDAMSWYKVELYSVNKVVVLNEDNDLSHWKYLFKDIEFTVPYLFPWVRKNHTEEKSEYDFISNWKLKIWVYDNLQLYVKKNEYIIQDLATFRTLGKPNRYNKWFDFIRENSFILKFLKKISFEELLKKVEMISLLYSIIIRGNHHPETFRWKFWDVSFRVYLSRIKKRNSISKKPKFLFFYDDVMTQFDTLFKGRFQNFNAIEDVYYQYVSNSIQKNLHIENKFLSSVQWLEWYFDLFLFFEVWKMSREEITTQNSQLDEIQKCLNENFNDSSYNKVLSYFPKTVRNKYNLFNKLEAIIRYLDIAEFIDIQYVVDCRHVLSHWSSRDKDIYNDLNKFIEQSKKVNLLLEMCLVSYFRLWVRNKKKLINNLFAELNWI